MDMIMLVCSRAWIPHPPPKIPGGHPGRRQPHIQKIKQKALFEPVSAIPILSYPVESSVMPLQSSVRRFSPLSREITL